MSVSRWRQVAQRWWWTTAFVAAMLAFWFPVLAHEDEAPDPHVAEAVAPGFAAIGFILLVVAALGLWYYLRRRAMLRRIMQGGSTSALGGPPSANR